MDATTAKGESCTTPFLLCELEVGGRDKLGNTIQQIIWLGPEYAVYRSDEGVHVHFSDDPEKEKDQRKRFTEICPELCELRYLTAQMRVDNPLWRLALRRATSPLSTSPDHGHALFEHNMA